MNFAPPVIRLNDLISGTVVTMDEWIKNEIYRLQHNIKPRHCQNYSELAEMLHEDPGRFQHHYHQHLPPPPPCLPEEFVHSGSDSDEEDYDEQQAGVDSMDHDHDEDEEEDGEDADEDDKDATDQTHQQHTQLTPLVKSAATPSPPSWLCRVFIELMRYCDRITIQDNAPKLLLYEFQQLRINMSLGKTIDIDEFRDSLSNILFGKIQMTEHLVQVWKLMCEWVTKPPLHTHQNAIRWLDLTLCAFIAAEQLFIVGNENKR
ncbi:uncharacterized protein ATC70_005960 [Mucor velutinosus]|uniref:Uncharacterized protein n=1 Tax=Mucor velutinosus TaxID=708070 RepID=A0AAN7HYW2_9FUNG|nr:hypothetical protein ATC70_005960 [Mucor velutinosus]